MCQFFFFFCLTQGLSFLKMELKLLLKYLISYSKICEPSLYSFPHFFSIQPNVKALPIQYFKKKNTAKNHFNFVSS